MHFDDDTWYLLAEEQNWHAPKFRDRLKCEFEMKTTEEQGIGAHSLAHNTFGVEGHAGALKWD
jgi:hypothetical protein